MTATAAATIWPNFFIVGGVKCGTTTLYEHLKQHPQVFLPDMKEPSYFMDSVPPPSDFRKREDRAGDREGYLALYSHAEAFRAIGDASPYYLWDNGAAERIHKSCPEARIIVILRDPVQRAYSQYLKDPISGFDTKLGFYDTIRNDQQDPNRNWWRPGLYVELGLYHEQVKRYIEIFGRDRVLVVLVEDLKNNPMAFYSRIASHLGIEHAPFANINLTEAYNTFRTPRFRTAYMLASRLISRELRYKLLPTRVVKFLRFSPMLYSSRRPPLDDQARRYLQGIYGPDLTRLEQLLGRELPELRKSWI